MFPIECILRKRINGKYEINMHLFLVNNAKVFSRVVVVIYIPTAVPEISVVT